jgi:arylsulfatase A-like enzyme
LPSSSPPVATAADSSVAPKSARPASVSGDGGAPTGNGVTSGVPADLNVIVLSIDSLRADMPWAGYPRPIAPRLTELEKRAVSYTHAYAISSYTSMSLGGFLGGKVPSEMKRSGFFFGKYPADDLLFPEVLQASGVRTIAAHAHGYFKDAGFEQGFDVFEIVPGIVFKNETDPNVTSPQHEAIAEKQLSDPALESKRFFAWYHFLDPHDQYIAHDKDGIAPYGPKLRDKYDAEVTFTDRYVGKLLDFIDSKSWGKRTAIIVTADHGEAFGEHGMFSHGFELWENLVRVPLFLVVPGAEPKRITTPRSTIDLAPTILELLGVPLTATATPNGGAGAALDLEGTSLVPEITGKEPPPPRDVVIDLPMTSDNDKRRAVVHGPKDKVIAFGKEELVRVYDIEADPEEKSPVARTKDNAEAYDELVKRYRDISARIKPKEVAPYACAAGCLNRAYATGGGK